MYINIYIYIYIYIFHYFIYFENVFVSSFSHYPYYPVIPLSRYPVPLVPHRIRIILIIPLSRYPVIPLSCCPVIPSPTPCAPGLAHGTGPWAWP